MEKVIRVGLIGFGVGGQIFHAPVLTIGARIGTRENQGY